MCEDFLVDEDRPKRQRSRNLMVAVGKGDPIPDFVPDSFGDESPVPASAAPAAGPGGVPVSSSRAPMQRYDHPLPINPNAGPDDNPFVDVPLPTGFREKPLN